MEIYTNIVVVCVSDQPQGIHGRLIGGYMWMLQNSNSDNTRSEHSNPKYKGWCNKLDMWNHTCKLDIVACMDTHACTVRTSTCMHMHGTRTLVPVPCKLNR